MCHPQIIQRWKLTYEHFEGQLIHGWWILHRILVINLRIRLSVDGLVCKCIYDIFLDWSCISSSTGQCLSKRRLWMTSLHAFNLVIGGRPQSFFTSGFQKCLTSFYPNNDLLSHFIPLQCFYPSFTLFVCRLSICGI